MNNKNRKQPSSRNVVIPFKREAYLFLLFMNRMLPAERAELLYLKAFGMKFLVLARRVITALASRATIFNKFSHFGFSGNNPGILLNAPTFGKYFFLGQNLRDNTGSDRASTLTNGEAKFLLHGDRGDELG